MEWEEMGYIFYPRKFNTKAIMKLIAKGGFSSKLRIECLVESGHEARTHPRHPPQVIRHNHNHINLTKTQEETSRNKVSIPEGVLGLIKG